VAPIIERIGSGCTSNLMRVLIRLTAPVKLLGQRLWARDCDRQVAEIQIRAAILKGFTALGIPRTVAVG